MRQVWVLKRHVFDIWKDCRSIIGEECAPWRLHRTDRQNSAHRSTYKWTNTVIHKYIIGHTRRLDLTWLNSSRVMQICQHLPSTAAQQCAFPAYSTCPAEYHSTALAQHHQLMPRVQCVIPSHWHHSLILQGKLEKPKYEMQKYRGKNTESQRKISEVQCRCVIPFTLPSLTFIAPSLHISLPSIKREVTRGGERWERKWQRWGKEVAKVTKVGRGGGKGDKRWARRWQVHQNALKT